MDLVFCAEGRFIRKENGNVYSLDGSLTNNLWTRYLKVFERIFVMARVLTDERIGVRQEYLASSDRVYFIDLPYYVGPFQYIKVWRKTINIISEHTVQGRAYICRVPGQIGNMVSRQLQMKNIPYGVEVVGDPWDVFAPGGVDHFLRFFFRYYFSYYLKKNVKNAAAAIYVTEYTLQRKYPIASCGFQFAASDVQIDDAQLPVKPKCFSKQDVYQLISVGSLEQMYKAPDIVLHSIKELKDRGMECRLTWLGEGVYKTQMLSLARQLEIDNQVFFVGNVQSKEVIKQLSMSDIFLLVSRTEGLPRALVEAMAMGLPCIGTDVGGIPELLDGSVLIPKDDVGALTDKIEMMIRDTKFSSGQAHRNYEKAKNYYDSVLNEKRELFYHKLISLS